MILPKRLLNLCMMSTLEKSLLLSDFESKFKQLNKKQLSRVIGGEVMAGGGSCDRTGSSSKCDSTAVCNCNPPQPPILKPAGN